MCKLFPHHSSSLNVNLMEYLKGKRKKEGKEKWTEEKIKRRKEKKRKEKKLEERRKQRKKKEKRNKRIKRSQKKEGKRGKKEKRKEKKEEKSEEKKRKERKNEREGQKKKKAPNWHPTPTSRLVSSCHRQDSSLSRLLPSPLPSVNQSPPVIVKTLHLTHFLPAPGPGSGPWPSGVQTTLFSDVSVAGSESRRRPSANN